MKKSMARWLSALLAVLMLVSVLPLNVFAATTYSASKYTKNATLQNNLESILNGKYGPGKFYTKNGKTCSCHNKNYDSKGNFLSCSAATSSECNCLRKVEIKGKKIDLHATQCFGYSRYCQHMLFGVDDANNGKSFKTLSGVDFSYAVKNKNGKVVSYKFYKDYETRCKNWFVNNKQNLHVGTHLRVYGGGHSIVILNVDYNNGKVTILECNWTNQSNNNAKEWCKVNPIKTLTWKDFAKKYYDISYAKVLKDFKTKYPDDAPKMSYTVSASVNEITNTSVKIKASLSGNPTVAKWSCGIGTEPEVKKMKVFTENPKDYDDTDTFEYAVRSIKNGIITIDKINEEPLKPDTTYYFRVCAKVGDTWYQQSQPISFKTKKDQPTTSTISILEGSEKVGKGTQVQVSWTKTKNTDSYDIVVKDLSGSEIQKKEKLNDSPYVLKSINTPGNYTVTVFSNGNTGQKTQGSSATFTIMDDVTVKFYDTVLNEVISEKAIAYGSDAYAPTAPSHYGYSFVKWDRSYTNVKEDITVNTVFNTSSYTVRFIDSLTNEVLGKAQSVPFQTAATAPAKPNFSKHEDNGYIFVSWDKDFSCIEKDTDVYAVFKWKDEKHSAILDLNSVTPHPGATSGTSIGYDVTCTIKNKLTEKISGRIVAVLKSKDGAILTQTDSTAFVVDETTDMVNLNSRTVSFFIKYPLLADKIELYLVNDYTKLGQVSAMATKNIDNGNLSSDWVKYEGNCPVQGDSVIIDNDYSEIETVRYYRYKRKLTSTSPTTPEGFTQDGFTLVNKQTKTNEYVASWPAGFLKTNTLYKTYNKAAIKASETDTQKIVIDKTETSGYIYWHWCMGSYKNGPINRGINGTKTTNYPTFHAFKQSAKISYNDSADAYKKSHSSVCTDTYWWYGKTPDKEGNIEIKKQTYSIYDKQYTYYSGYSEWIPYTSESGLPVEGTAVGDGTTYYAIETKEETHTWHRYRYASFDFEPDDDCIISISESVENTDLTGEVTVWIYKYAQASDYTTEYVGNTTIVEDVLTGEKRIELNNIVLREAQFRGGPDYTIAVSAPGYEQAFIVGTIKAPKKFCDVTFYDEFKNIIKTITVEEGDSIPQEDQPVLTYANGQIGEGKEFVTWKASLVDIRHEELNVYPVVISKKFTITKIDWNSQNVSFIEDCEYGEALPEISDKPTAVEGCETDWYVITDDGYILYDEYKENVRTIKSNVLVVSKNIPIVWRVTIVDADYNRNLSDYATDESIRDIVYGEEENIDGLSFSNIEVENSYSIEYSDLADVEESEDIEFINWINAIDGSVVDGTNINQNMILYPVYRFHETTDAPEADFADGEFNAPITVSLECSTDNAVIWYTINGGDPKTDPGAIMYTGPITVSDHSIIKYYATALGCNDSETQQSVFAINDGSGEPVKHVLSFAPTGNDFYLPLYKPFSLLVDNNITISSVMSEFPELEGYNLDAFYSDPELERQISINEPLNTSTEVFVNYVSKQYTVTFVDELNAPIVVKTVLHGLSVDAPKYPFVKEGYVFTGWDADLEYVTEDLTVRPKFITEDEYATVAISKKGISLYAGNQITLSSEITPIYHNGYDVKWYSEDESIATVDENGIVTGESKGTTRIVAELPYTGAKAYCTVKVSYDLEQELVVMSDSQIGFDSERNVRVTPSVAHTVNDIISMFENSNITVFKADGAELSSTDLVGTGCIVKLMLDDEVVDSATVVLTGDYNGDGSVNNKDVVMLNQLVLGKREAELCQMIALDVNGDGYVNNKDCAMLSRYLVGKEVIG